MEPFTFEFSLKEFDLELLPVERGLLERDERLLRDAIRRYLSATFERLGGQSRITAYDDRIHVAWTPVAAEDDWSGALGLAVDLLQRRAFALAEPLLVTLERRMPEAPPVLYNYGMMLSDLGRLDEAVDRLAKLTTVDPGTANGWVALGVALLRQGRKAEAITALKRAVELDPDNGYAHRNLGAALAEGDALAALPHLKRAVELLPGDQRAHHGYGMCLMHAGDVEAADKVFRRSIEIDQFTEVSEESRRARTRIAQDLMRRQGGTGPMMDVVMYCLGALEAFRDMGAAKARAVTVEIALLGRDGLDINDPTPRYRLRSMEGEFTARQMLAYMYVGIKQMDPQLDAGVDFSKEYEMARTLFDGRGGPTGEGRTSRAP